MEQKQNIELKGCPFCGEAPKELDNPRGGKLIFCPGCGSQAFPGQWNHRKDDIDEIITKLVKDTRYIASDFEIVKNPENAHSVLMTDINEKIIDGMKSINQLFAKLHFNCWHKVNLYLNAQKEIEELKQKIVWKKYPENKPDEKKTCLIFNQEGNDDIVRAYYHNGRFWGYEFESEDKKDVRYWCYESDLIASIPQTKGEVK